jgi:hypothetical protein
MTELEAALYSKLTSDATLMSIVTGIYTPIAPPDAAYPFVVFNLVDAIDEPYTLTQRVRTRFRYQFTCVVQGYSKAAAYSALQRIDELLTRQPLSVQGHDTWLVERISIGPAYYDVVDGVLYQYVPADYRIEVA